MSIGTRLSTHSSFIPRRKPLSGRCLNARAGAATDLVSLRVGVFEEAGTRTEEDVTVDVDWRDADSVADVRIFPPSPCCCTHLLLLCVLQLLLHEMEKSFLASAEPQLQEISFFLTLRSLFTCKC
ncbi:hypothetical protein L798_03542 [Zootermopsis nevadensis]|uniref:Uncharacterized protein n=1 Tax=Zootermopsis nevadensis TaxID=136037 RepID=A0A067RPB9_ZOONE|nr:hypothetical protein L798_03542 [Zootermopsis nevadensis]